MKFNTNYQKSKEYIVDNLVKYLNIIKKSLDSILIEERENIEKASDIISKKIAEGKLLYIFGTGGHSIMAGEELFKRAGGLALISPIFFPGVSLVTGLSSNTRVERVPGIAKFVMESHGLKEGDVLIINNAAGINALTIDAALLAKERGITVIGIVSKEFANNVPPGHEARHPSNKNLHEVSDVSIDIKVPLGDAVIDIEGLEQKTAPISTINIAFVLHSLIIRVIEKLLQKGIQPPVWRSANIPGGTEYNKNISDKYLHLIKHL